MREPTLRPTTATAAPDQAPSLYIPRPRKINTLQTLIAAYRSPSAYPRAALGITSRLINTRAASNSTIARAALPPVMR